jgi:hypothetical protein
MPAAEVVDLAVKTSRPLIQEADLLLELRHLPLKVIHSIAKKYFLSRPNPFDCSLRQGFWPWTRSCI